MRISDAAPVSAGKVTKKSNRFFLALAAGSLAVFAASCQKDNVTPGSTQLIDGNTTGVVVSPGSSASFTSFNTFGTLALNNSGVYTVTNFLQGTINNSGNPPHNANSTYYYSFTLNDGVGTADSADLQFSGTANADVTVLGSLSSLAYATSSFDNIVSGAVTPTWVNISTNKIGFNRTDTVNFAINTTTPGWYNYNIRRHVALPLVENSSPLTLLATVRNGDEYYIELQDVYSNRTPNSYITPSNYPYLHFRYKKLP